MLCKRQDQTSVSRNLWGQLCQEDLSVLEEVQANRRWAGIRAGAPSLWGRAGGEKLLAGVRPKFSLAFLPGKFVFWRPVLTAAPHLLTQSFRGHTFLVLRGPF